MAEQTYDLTQNGEEVQKIINDANNVKGAGAQTTLTTESILLKDVNGQYHKILKSSFTEAIRDTLASLLVNNDKGTTINQIAAVASGDFGSITPANLASVLGAQDNNGWSVVASHGSGESIFRLETVIGITTARSYVYTIEGCGTNVQHCIDCRVHFALTGSIAEGKKGDYHTISDSNFKVHFWGKYLYFSLMGNTAIRIISTRPMNLEEVNALPEGATQITLI